MKPSYCFTIICICCIMVSLTGVVTADSAQYDKYVSIHLNIDNGKVTTESTEISYGSAPNLIPTQEGFMGELVAADGSIVKTFTVWDPRVQFGDAITGTPDDPKIQGVVVRQNSADFVVTFPFIREVTEFRLNNPTEGTLLSSVNLKPQIDTFFASYPNDPDNPALYGSKAPATDAPPPAGTPDSGATTSGQFPGMLAMASGAAMLLVGGLASARFLRKVPKDILIVDDSQEISDVIAGMLKISGYGSRIATSGEECLKKLESAVPALILLDIGMEPMDGWETLKRIKKNPATKGIPVIMLTARKLIPKDVEEYGIFIDDYIMKPVTTQGLNDAITHVFSRQQMIREKIAAAKGAAINRDLLCEDARLTKVVDVNKRLWDLLVKTYDLESGMMQGVEDEVSLAIKNIEGTMRNQENRLAQVQRNLGSGIRG
jgi:DNA-binding response OmpR family regulator